jgi:hypothetical protein
VTGWAKQDDVQGKVKSVFARDSQGVWRSATKAFVKQADAWIQFYAAEIVATVAANINDLNVSTLFSSVDWASTTKKRVVIVAGVIIGATSVSTAALTTGAGLGGILSVENAGEIQGAPGAANSGAGGPAIQVSTASVEINNSGAIRSGGGGGGLGGNGGTGGNGSYTVSEGPLYTVNVYRWRTGSASSTVGINARWNGGDVIESNSGDYTKLTSTSQGNVTYYRAQQQSKSGSQVFYYISRQYPASMAGAAGGVGGSGGRGRGFGNSNVAGGVGAAGGNNGGNSGAGGTGGPGGAGGDWGTAGTIGATGSTGASGNATAGTAGTAGTVGGPAGAAIQGVARTVNNTGTIQGAMT